MRRLPTVLGAVLTLTVVTLLDLAQPAAGGGSPGAPHGAHPVRTSTADGQIVFRRYFDADQTRGALFVMDPDGTDLRQVTQPPDGWRDNVPAWSPDGRSIVFERFKSDESTSRVMVVDPDTGATHTVVPCTGRRCAMAIDPYFSPVGRSIAYSRLVAPPGAHHAQEWRLYSAVFVVGLDRSNPHQVTSTPPLRRGVPAAETTDPTFSPDGRLLAFIRTRGGPEEGSAVFVQPIGSPHRAERVTPWRMGCQDRPTFSPDGRHLLFRCTPQGEEGPSNLYLVRPDGAGLHRLTRPSARRQYLGSGFSPGFRGDSGWIVAGRTGGVGEDGNADVYALLVRHGRVVRSVDLTRSVEWDSGPGWGTHPPLG
jgi:Tol biopolymer transport system component